MSVEAGTSAAVILSGTATLVSYVARRFTTPPPEYMRDSPDWLELRWRYLVGRMFPAVLALFVAMSLILVLELIRSG